MKRSGLITLICSLVAVMVLCLSVVLIMIFTDVVDVVPEELVIASASATATYDGEALIDQNWSLLKGEIKKNHRLSVIVSGSQTNAGMSENYIFATVFDEDGVDVSEDYNIVYEPGTLNVKQRVITLTADSEIKLYDGTPLTSDKYSIDSPISLALGHQLTVTVAGEITDVGNVDNRITSVIIKNSKGDDVTKNYKIKTVDGKLAVYSPDTLVFKTESLVAEYTGVPISNPNYEMISGELNPGDVAEVKVTGAQLNVGTSQNTAEVTIFNKEGVDVTSNYKMLFDLGELSVTPKDITITSNSAQKNYDGEPLTDKGFTVSPSHAVSAGSIDVIITGTQTEVGESENTITKAYIYDSFGNDITANYLIEYVPGILSVYEPEEELPVEVTFKSGDGKKVYDGTPLRCETCDIEGQLKDGHVPYFEFVSELTEASKADNEFNVVIKDLFGNDVSDEYLINKEFGELAVEKAPITISSASDEKKFDGEPLKNPNYSVSLADYYSQHFTFEVVIEGSQTKVGSSSNTISSRKIFDENNENVTHNFEIKKEEGVLTVLAEEQKPKIKLTYETGSATKAYDGTPLANNECTRVEGELLEGHSEHVEMLSTLTEVGIIENAVKVYIFDGDKDVSDQYIISYKPGTLEVTPKVVTVKTAGAEKIYDRTPLSAPQYTVVPEDSLVEGHVLNATLPISILVPGTAKNEISYYQVLDAEGKDVTGFYEFSFDIGELKIKKRPIIIESASAAKYYDGTPLSADGYSVTPENALLSGHTLTVEITGTITEPGTAPNSIGAVTIRDENGKDVLPYYDVTRTAGTLAIMDRAPFFIVRGTAEDIVYLKFYSAGDYISKSSWTAAPEYTELLHGAQSAYYLPYYALEDSGLPHNELTVIPRAGIFALPYYSSPYQITQSSDVSMQGPAGASYTMSYYSWNSVGGLELPDSYLSYESDYCKFVRDNYRNIDDETLEFMQGIIEEEGLTLGLSGDRHTDLPILIDRVTNYIKRSARYDGDFELCTKLDNEDNMIIAFLSEYKQGVCRHYAAAATMLFRALDIPARYTVGIAGQIEPGIDTILTEENLHAWVEVYIEGLGWLKFEVTGEGNPVDGSNKPIVLEIAPSETRGQYKEGKTLYPVQSVSGFSELASRGYTYQVEISGSNSELGKTSSQIEQLVIYDPFGIVVYDKKEGIGNERFKITYKSGTIHNYISTLTFNSKSYTQEYNGKTLSLAVDDCYLLNGTLDDGYSYTITPNASLTQTGQKNATYKVTIYKNGQDCTDHYLISANYGKLTVTERTMTFTAGSATKKYDGEPLYCDELIYDPALLADGDYVADYVIEGASGSPQTAIGYQSNVIRTLVIKNSRGEDVTKCYILKFNSGLLTVTP